MQVHGDAWMKSLRLKYSFGTPAVTLHNMQHHADSAVQAIQAMHAGMLCTWHSNHCCIRIQTMVTNQAPHLAFRLGPEDGEQLWFGSRGRAGEAT